MSDQPNLTDKPDPCDMKMSLFDFAWCETHDSHFPLGGKCEWDGVQSVSEHLQSKVDEQMVRAVRAEASGDAYKHDSEHLRQQLASPPPGWSTFGSHVDSDVPLQFWGESPAGDPIWERPEPASRPRVVCLCGSTRFFEAFQQANYDRTMAGEIVLSVGFYPHSTDKSGHGEGVGHDSIEKVALEELHKRKIDLADYVLVLNVSGYVGDSTRSEIEYARHTGKPIEWLVPDGAPDLQN